jgi:hypothetical protein
MCHSKKPVVRNIRTNDLYFYEGENKFTNISSGVSGVVSDAAAQKTFRLNEKATYLLNEYPMVVVLINRLKLVHSNI